MRVLFSQIQIVSVACVLLAAACGGRPTPRTTRHDGNRSNEPLTSVMVSLNEIGAIKQPSAAPLDGYHLTIKKVNPDCSAMADIDETREWFQGKIIRSIPSTCSWVLGLQIGTLSADKKSIEAIYFQNISETQSGEVLDNLKNASNDALKLSVRLILTDKGWSAGYGDILLGTAKTTEEAGNSGSATGSASRPTEGGWIDVGVEVNQDGASAVSALRLYKGERKIGTVHPVYMMHASHGLTITRQGSNTVNEYDYADLWLAQELTKVFVELRKPPFDLTGASHLGIYNYRKIAGSSNLSRHSYALAIDLSGFTLADGTKITVEHDWKSGNHSELLHNIRDMLCRHFDVVLSPDYNSDHYNHFHVDLNPKYRSERELDSPVWSDLETKPSHLLFAVELGIGLSGGLDAEEPAGHSFSLASSERTCR